MKDQETLYRMLSEERPRSSAASALQDFIDDVAQLREKHGIPDAIVVASAYVTTDAPDERGSPVIVRSSAMGDPAVAAQLGATAYKNYTRPIIAHAEKLQNLANGVED